MEVHFLRSASAVPQLFTVRNSAIDPVVRNVAECGLKLGMPTIGLFNNIDSEKARQVHKSMIIYSVKLDRKEADN